MNIISTKSLSSTEKDMLYSNDIAVVDYDALSVSFPDFDNNILAHNAIITSRNAAKAVIEKKVIIKNCFCVGEKTQAYLEENGQCVSKMKQNASELAQFILKNHKNEQFWYYFCGNNRRPEIPKAFKKSSLSLKEIVVYNTVIKPAKVQEHFDGVLFFSPLGVESFLQENQLNESVAFCIGPTTGKAVKPHAKEVITATNPAVENVLDLVVKYAKKR